MVFTVYTIIAFLIALCVVIWRRWYEAEYKLWLFYAISSFLFSMLVWGILHFCNSSRAMFHEVWNYKIISVEYYEDWDEEVPCRHPRYETRTRTDSKGRTYTETVQVGYYHAYDVDYHPKHWDAIDEYSSRHSIACNDYEKWKQIWKNESFKDLHRDYHSKDGDEFYSVWTHSFDTVYPWSEINSYQNKIRVAKSVFNYQDVTPEVAKKFQRPVDLGSTSPFVTYGVPICASEELLMRRVNALQGKAYRIHNLIVLFDASKYNVSDSDLMKMAWKGPNKNELVTCIGIDNNTKDIVWVNVFSWMDDTTIHSLIRQDLFTMKKYDTKLMAQVLQKRVPTHWKKKDFRDFDYLKVQMPASYVIISLIILVLGHIGLVWFFISSVERDYIYERIQRYSPRRMYS